MAPSESDIVHSDSDFDAIVIARDDISNYNPEQILPLKPEEIQNIRSWLQPTSYDIAGGEYRKHLASHIPGTGAWITSSNTYQEWLNSTEHGLLWIRGIPGSGKSVIAANLVSELAKSNPGSPVLFFFFRQIIDANHEPEALLRDWMDQMLRYSPPLQKQLLTYVEGNRAIGSLSMEDMWKDLRMAFTHLSGKVFCVGDALDEMDRGYDAFLEALGSLGQWRPETVKLLITSRPVPSVEMPLRKILCLRLRLEESLVDVDISTYVHFALSNSTIPRSSWEIIADAVPGRANGLFLYAKLAMDAFLEPDSNINTVLSQLPMDLNTLYTNLLKEHAQRSGVADDIQNLILQSVTHATRPLRLLELAEMIKVYSPDGSTRDLKATKDLIRAACGPLLEILADETVSVIHHSFTEYLKGTTRADDGTGHPVLKAGPTHAQLSLACLRYLQSGCLLAGREAEGDSDEMDDNWDDDGGHIAALDRINMEMKLRLEHPFYDYAASNWQHHVRSSEAAGYNQTKVNAELSKFLGHSETMKVWIRNRWPRKYNPSKPVTKVHIAAKAGLVSYTRELLGIMEVDARDADGRTPLWWAATEGHVATLRELIAAGANPDQDDEISGLKPLHEAASNNHFEVVSALLEAGVDPLTPKTRENPGMRCGNAPGSTRHTPLMYACENGHLEAVDAFMPFLNDIDTVHRALAWAADHGASKVVARILQHPGVDVNAHVHGDTALFRACGARDLATIEILLKAGADPNSDCEKDLYESYGTGRRVVAFSGKVVDLPKYNCLHRLCDVGGNGYRDPVEPEVEQGIFSLLVRAGVDIHRRAPASETALHGAIRSSAVLTRLLLDAGADVNAVDDSCQTPLHMVEHEGPMVILIEQGHADINSRDAQGRTPLLRLLSTSHIETSLKFLEYGPDCNVVNKNGEGVLHISLKRRNSTPEIIKGLLKAGADPNLKNRDGLAPILTMRDYGRESTKVVDVLLQAGADIDAVDKEGNTLLFHLASKKPPYHGEDSHADLVDLIARGASTSSRDFSGRTLLHEGVRSHESAWTFGKEANVPRLDFLLGLGLDVKAVDYHGNGLLHELALLRDNHSDDSRYSAGGILIPLWEKLIALGLDLGQGNYAGRTPLHILCAANHVNHFRPGDVMPIDFVILRTENINVADNDGNTPLHLAVTVGQTYAKRLLEAGADPTAATHEGLTPLHLASRSRHPNVVGLLLDALRRRQVNLSKLGGLEIQYPPGEAAPAPVPAIWVDAEVFNRSHITPLYYACRSGRPETVVLLLKAGANVNGGDILQACAEFEKEDDLWWEPHPSEDHWRNGGVKGLKLDDKSRRGSSDGRPSRRWGELAVNETTRLAEILDMLVAYGADLSKSRIEKWIRGPVDRAVRGNREYTAACLRDLRKRWQDGGETPRLKSVREFEDHVEFSEHVSHSLQEASVQALRDFKPPQPGHNNQALFQRFIARREYHLVEELACLGTSFLPNPELNSVCNLSLLIRHGFASLVESIGTLEAASRLEKGDWHAFGDTTRPGLWLAKPDVSEPGGVDYNPIPFILEAVQRELPNMDVLRLLVEKFAVDINEMHYTRKYIDGSFVIAPTGSALHSVSSGTCWWHVYQALPYLLKAGAELYARDDQGQTPLHIALASRGNCPGPFSGEAARMLIEAGADVNAVDKHGWSCLSCAKNDVGMTEFLISHGATVTADALFTAIDAANVSALRALLSGGVDPNIRRDKPTPREDTSSKTDRSRRTARKSKLYLDREVVDGVEPHEVFPLYHATRHLRAPDKSKPRLRKVFEKKLEIVQVLLDHGADPFSKFLRIVDDKKSCGAAATPGEVPEGYEECMVLHQLLIRGQFANTFLDLPELDVNRRDARGLTVLHAACRGMGPDYVISPYRLNADTGNRGATTIFERLLSLGANPSARDNSDRSALHVMVGDSLDYVRFEKSLAEALARAPELINQSDTNGKTPLHHAMSRTTLPRKRELVNVLLTAGADPLAVDENGNTVLHLLTSNLGSVELCAIFKDMVERGVDVNARNVRGETPLWPYCVRSSESQSHTLWNRFSETEEEAKFSEKNNATPVLMGLGADFLARDGKGRGLLHVAANGGVDRFKELMGLGLDAMLEDEGQRTAIDIAAACGNSEVLELFEKKDGVQEKVTLC